MIRKKGLKLLRDSRYSKSTAFTRAEREEHGLRGLLPYAESTQELQTNRILANMRREKRPLEKYIFLSALEDRNQRLFYKALMDHIDELMPIVYTPTVGEVCKKFSHIFRKEKGFFITPEDKGEIAKILDNWPSKNIKVVVVTDGQRILGLGDLGANGMGIPIGKLSLYVAGAGIHPDECLPVMIDVGTNNEELLDDILYLGYPEKRMTGEPYFELVDEFVQAIQDKYPGALIQFEDFLTPNAYALLNRYKNKVLCFNDDIQGTAAVALSGVLASNRITGHAFKDLRIMFLGAGSAATGIADLMVTAFMEAGLDEAEAKRRLWFVDIDGLVVKGRDNLMSHNLPYAHDHPKAGFLEAMDTIRPQVLIGASGAGGAFTQEVVEKMSTINERPVIFALSNPTSKSECTAKQAYTWSEGRAVFASGSPFKDLAIDGKKFRPGQGNNVYIFPGIGLGAIMAQAQTLPESIFLTAAKVLADQVTKDELIDGKIYPELNQLRTISKNIALAVANRVFELGLTDMERPDDIEAVIEEYVYDPTY